MKTGFFAAILFALSALLPAAAQQVPEGEVIGTFGQWRLTLYPEQRMCALVSAYPTQKGEPAIVQLIAVGEQFTLQISDPFFTYNPGEEFGTVIETEDESRYVRMEVDRTRHGHTFLMSKMDLDPAAQLFVQLVRADTMTLRYKNDSYQYELNGLDRAGRQFLRCNAFTLQMQN